MGFGLSSRVRTVLLLSGLAACSAAHAQGEAPQPAAPATTQPAGEPAKAADAPQLELERHVQDWGLVSDQDLLRTEIKFKNTGKATLLIADLKPSCGCVRPTLRGDKKTYAPGEEGVIDVGFEPMNKQGAVIYNITVRSNDAAKSVQTIDVKCDVKPKVGFESPDGLSFGTVDAGGTKSLTFYMFGRASDFKATFATIDAERGFDVKVGETVEADHRGDKVHKTPITVTMKENARAARFSHTVVVRHTDKSVRNGLFEVTVTGEVLHDVRPDKKELDFGVHTAEEMFETEFTLTNVKGKEFKVTELRYRATKGPQLEFTPIFAPVADKPGVVTVKVRGMAPAKPGDYQGIFQMATDLKGMPAVNVPVKLLVRQGA